MEIIFTNLFSQKIISNVNTQIECSLQFIQICASILTIGMDDTNNYECRVHTQIENIFKHSSRTTFDFQGPPARKVIHRLFKNANSQSTLTELSALNSLLHHLLCIFQFTCLTLIINSCMRQKNPLCKSPLSSLMISFLSWTSRKD